MIRRLNKLVPIVLAWLVMSAGSALPARAGPMQELEKLPPELREYVIKAAFLFNFARFTEWPAAAFQAASSPLRLCILGTDPFGKALDSLAGKTIKDRRIEVSHLLWAEEAAQCHVLFVSDSASTRLEEIFELLDGRPVLTVGDMPEAAYSGGIIGLKIVEQKIRFLVNPDNAENAGLQVSSRLMTIGEVVRNGVADGVSPNEAKRGTVR